VLEKRFRHASEYQAAALAWWLASGTLQAAGGRSACAKGKGAGRRADRRPARAQAACAGAAPACRAIFLHVATYNAAARALYRRCGFQEVARLPAFYHIACAPCSGIGLGYIP